MSSRQPPCPIPFDAATELVAQLSLGFEPILLGVAVLATSRTEQLERAAGDVVIGDRL
jgi:hypothetical protein